MPVCDAVWNPHRGYSSTIGGFATLIHRGGSTLSHPAWVSPATIIVEPDALAMAGCLSPDQRQERFDWCHAVGTLTAAGRCRVRR